MSRKIEDLREHLFAALEGLRDKNNPMDIERARAIADVSRVIVDSAKVECDHMKLTGSDGSGFIPDAAPRLEGPGRPRLVKGRDNRGA